MDEKVPIEIYKFEPLFGKDIKGKIKTWDLKVERYQNYSEIVTLYGYKHLIETRRQINSGKNIGKANMTTTWTQAMLEAKSKWTKKRNIDQFYPESDKIIKPMEDVDMNNSNKNANPLPMLAHDYKKHKHKIIYPALVQMKLDGMRMIYNTTSGQITTRQGKQYNIVKESGKLYEELQKLPKGLILDGELYTNKFNFEVLGVLRKTKKLTNEEQINLEKIEYHIYDVIDTELTFENRNRIVKDIFNESYQKLIYVNTFLVKNEDEIKEYHSKFLLDKYEGTMIRNKGSLYKTKCRSSDLLKYKDFIDAEFKIVDFTFECDTSGNDENLIVWIVQVSENKTCKVRPQGTVQERKELYKKCTDDFSQFKNRKLWTKFFEYTADNSLRFPTTKTNSYESYIRDEIL